MDSSKQGGFDASGRGQGVRSTRAVDGCVRPVRSRGAVDPGGQFATARPAVDVCPKHCSINLLMEYGVQVSGFQGKRIKGQLGHKSDSQCSDVDASHATGASCCDRSDPVGPGAHKNLQTNRKTKKSKPLPFPRGTMLGPFSDHVWTMFGPCLGHPWSMCGACWGHFWTIF